MLKTLAALLLLSVAAFPAGEPAGFHIWKAADIIAKGKDLATKLNGRPVDSEALDTVGNRAFSVAHREGVGQTEWHEKQADLIMIQAGTVTVICGGEVVDGKTVSPGEIRGASIKGGIETVLGPGDVLHIPAKTPHMMKALAPGGVTYFVTKVTE
jgi:mannose-6-phosphate isomerase-like protein (cupin superfamily)